VKHPREDTSVYKRRLRYYLTVRRREILADDSVCCPNPEHGIQGDTEYAAKLIEGESGDCVQCDTCATNWDIFDIDGFLSGTENTKSTFPARLAAVKDALATVLPEVRPADAKPLVELTDEEVADLARRQREAARETAANRQRIRDEASDLMERERRKTNDAREKDLPFRIYGVASDGFAYFEDRHGRLVSLRLGSLTKTQLQLLAPITWWVQQFEGGRGRLRVDDAIDFLIEMANAKSFELSSLRGRGCWREE
jgi:hypothetical protein